MVGSGNVSLAVNPLFAVIDFTDPNNPSEVDVTSAAGGTIVDCNGVHAAVGDANGGRVWIYDITNPASPLRVGDTHLETIGNLSYNGTHVLAGGTSGSAVLIDASNSQLPADFFHAHYGGDQY